MRSHHHPTLSCSACCRRDVARVGGQGKVVSLLQRSLTCGFTYFESWPIISIHHVLWLVAHLVWLFCDPVDCSPPGSSVHGILLARILEWVAYPFSRGFSQPRNQTGVSCIAGGFFTSWATREAPSWIYLFIFGQFNRSVSELVSGCGHQVTRARVFRPPAG